MRGYLMAGLIAVWATGAAAVDFGLADPRRAEAFAAEARAIAEGAGQVERMAPELKPSERALLSREPLLEEAWRTDPEATLDLIRRIIDAGAVE